MAVAGKPLGAATVTFSAGAADPAQCALTPSKGSATADGKDAITLEAVIRDAKGASDCNDGNALLVPGGAEVCDDIDNGCGKFTPKALAQVEAPFRHRVHLFLRLRRQRQRRRPKPCRRRQVDLGSHARRSVAGPARACPPSVHL